MKPVKITHNGFHGIKTETIRPRRIAEDAAGIPVYVVSMRIANKLNRAVCGIRNCTCGEVWATHRMFGEAAVLVGKTRGLHPQD